MVFHWSLSDSKFPQVPRTLLSILAVLSNTVIWIVSTRPSTSKSSRPFHNPLVIVPKAPITIGTIVTFMFHSFFNSQARSRYLSFSHSFSFILWSARTTVDNFANFFFFKLLLSLVFWPRLGDPCVCQSPIGVYACHFLRTGAGLCIYHLLVWSNLNFFHISQWIIIIIRKLVVTQSPVKDHQLMLMCKTLMSK